MLRVLIDREKLRAAMKGITFKYLHQQVVEFGLEVEYPTLMANLRNSVNWNLLYAWCVCEVLNVKIEDLFYLEGK